MPQLQCASSCAAQLTGAVGGVTLAAFIYLVSASTLADPAELYRRYHGEEYMRSYYRRPDGAFWAECIFATDPA